MEGVFYMNMKMLPFFELAEENKRRHFKDDVLDGVIRFPRLSYNLNLEVYHYVNFCRYDGIVEDLLIVFNGNKYDVFKFGL